MSNETRQGEPAAPRSSAGLGPVAWVCWQHLTETHQRAVSAGYCHNMTVTTRQNTPDKVPLYDQAALDDAVFAERERCAELARSKAGLFASFADCDDFADAVLSGPNDRANRLAP